MVRKKQTSGQGAAPASATRKGPGRKLELMWQVMWHMPVIYHRVTGISAPLYATYGLTAGKRSLLHDVLVKGPHTIAEMVRVRPPVARQYIQRLVAELKRSGLVVLAENPADRRTKVVRLTAKGRRVMEELTPIENMLTQLLAEGHSVADLEATSRVLARVAALLEDEDFWSQQL